MEEIKQGFLKLKEALVKLSGQLDLATKKARIAELTALSSEPQFWQDDQNAKTVMQDLADLKEEVEAVEGLRTEVNDSLELIEMAGDQPEGELNQDLKQTLTRLEGQIQALSRKLLLSGPYDANNAIVSVHAGQGGTEAMDWAQMIVRMYLRYAERQGYTAESLYESRGEEAGIKEATYLIKGKLAYGYLKGEQGTHRLVRQSPFNADKLRQTSFALVEVMPQIEEAKEIDIKEEDLTWAFMRAGGHGGQNVNKVNTAVRLTHIPTGLVVECRTERYQEQNRKYALALLRGKLWQRQERERQEQMAKLKGGTMASWGSQIRNYVLHPYHLVKDVRTQVESTDTEAVLDGELDQFIEAELSLTTS